MRSVDERLETLEDKADTLESALGRFIINTNMYLNRFEKGLEALRDEMKAFKDEMKDFKDEMKAFKDEMKDFKDEMLAFKDEMKDFKDEMLAFKDEMKDFKDEMLAFKDEMKDFKDEMLAFKDEMKDFKDEMKDFKDETRKDRIEMNKQWGALANKMGTIDEDLIAPAARPVLAKYFKCEPIDRTIRFTRRIGSESFEVDVLVACEDKVFMIEVKSAPKVEYVEQILQKAEKFKVFFPEYKDKETIPIYASIIFPDEVLNHATRSKLYVMAYREWEYMDILNFDEVKSIELP
ncbi:MAG: hypothetical protein ACUVWN_03940 [bacterium]